MLVTNSTVVKENKKDVDLEDMYNIENVITTEEISNTEKVNKSEEGSTIREKEKSRDFTEEIVKLKEKITSFQLE